MNKTLKVVLHVSDIELLPRMQSNIINLLEEDPSIVISVVVNSIAVKGFIKGSKIKLNNKASYFICKNSLLSNKISEDDLIEDALITSSSVYKIALLQQDGYLYIKV